MKDYESYFKNILKNKKLKIELVGSYKTGKAKTEGAHDIDILITYNKVKITIDELLEYLKDVKIGVLSKGSNRATLLCKLKNDSYVRHLDILITSKKSYYPALLYFGSGVDKIRKLRGIAKKGYKLNEYDLTHIKMEKNIIIKKY